jgi:VPDSG-CTERM motif
MLTFAQNASATPRPVPPDFALTFNDTHVLGTITPNNPSDPTNERSYVNFMISLALGGSGNVVVGPHVNHITRSTNVFANLPQATGGAQGTGTSVDLGTGVYSYLLAKYDGRNDLTMVWYVGNLSGSVMIPLLGPRGHALSHWTLFGPGGAVPDGGATVMLLGAALGALGIARRFLMS